MTELLLYHLQGRKLEGANAAPGEVARARLARSGAGRLGRAHRRGAKLIHLERVHHFGAKAGNIGGIPRR